MTTHIVSTDDVYSAAAGHLCSVLQGYVSATQSVLILLSGGSAVRFYPYFAEWIKEYPTRSFSGKLAVGQVDERFKPERGGEGVGGSDPPSHKAMARQGGIDGRNININAIHIGETGLWEVCREKGIAYHLISQVGTVEGSSSEYNLTISDLWKSVSKKIAVLGIGEDGHTAGLLPGYQQQWDVDRMVVGYKNDGPFPQRISLTPKALTSLDYAIVVAAGEKKRPVLDQWSSGKEKRLNAFPAAIFHEMKAVEIFTDINV